jgi:hypothetical protein
LQARRVDLIHVVRQRRNHEDQIGLNIVDSFRQPRHSAAGEIPFVAVGDVGWLNEFTHGSALTPTPSRLSRGYGVAVTGFGQGFVDDLIGLLLPRHVRVVDLRPEGMSSSGPTATVPPSSVSTNTVYGL